MGRRSGSGDGFPVHLAASPIGDVRGYGVVEEHGLLANVGDVAPQIFQDQLVNIRAIQGD